MPRPKQHTVRLNNEEQAQLKALIRKGEGNARVSTRARILLLADDNCFDEDVAEMLKVSASTVLSIRRRFVTEGLEAALYDKPRSGAVPKLDGKQEALLVALACSQPNDRES